MDLPDLRLDFYGATIREASVGPRREVALALSDMGGSPTRMRFGGITNFDEVRSFFGAPPADSLHFLRYHPVERSKPGRLVIEMEFDRCEDRIVIRCANIVVTDEAGSRSV